MLAVTTGGEVVEPSEATDPEAMRTGDVGPSCARGGPEFTHDLDLFVAREDADKALEILVRAGLEAEHPPERLLVKAWNGPVPVDLIPTPIGLTVDRELLAGCGRLPAAGLLLPRLGLEDVLCTKLLAFDEHYLEYSKVLQVARAIREQVDWLEVRERCGDSPYANGFFFLASELGTIAAGPDGGGAPRASLRPVAGTPDLHPIVGGMMSLTDRISGRLKKAAGELVDDAALRRKGRRQERKGEAKEELGQAQRRADAKAREVADLERRTS